MVVRASGRIGSSRTMAPASRRRPRPRHSKCLRGRCCAGPVAWPRAEGRSRATQSSLPSATCTPPTSPSIPAPWCSCTASGKESWRPRGAPRPRAARRARAARPGRARRRGGGSRRRRGRRRCGPRAGRSAGGQRAGLVEQQDAGPRERLERRPALDDDAAPRRRARCPRRSPRARRGSADRASPRRAPRARAPDRRYTTRRAPPARG